MNITSNVFKENESIPSSHTCDGKRTFIPLEIQDIPKETKSLVIIFDDPDTPIGLFTHWVVFNIPHDYTNITSEQVPNAQYGLTTAQTTNWVAPCPPDREHRYFFKVFALNTILELPNGCTREQVEKAMKNHILETSQLMGLYKRITIV